MDKMVSYKRYASNLVIANIVTPTVWILLAISLAKTLDTNNTNNNETNNQTFLVASMVAVSAANMLAAYFGIIGIIRRYTCELDTYYVLARIAIISETFVNLMVLFTDNQFNGQQHPIISTVHTGVAIALILAQIWLLYETRNYQRLVATVLDDDGDDGDDGFNDFSVRRMSLPPNICADIEKQNPLFTLTDQLLVNTNHTNNDYHQRLMMSRSHKDSIGSQYNNLNHSNNTNDTTTTSSAATISNNDNTYPYNYFNSSSSGGGGQSVLGRSPVYQTLTQPIHDDSGLSFSNFWSRTTTSGGGGGGGSRSVRTIGDPFPKSFVSKHI